MQISPKLLCLNIILLILESIPEQETQFGTHTAPFSGIS